MPTFNVNDVDWNQLYDGKAGYAPGDPGWNIGRLQPELAELEQRGLFTSPVLDSGCGVGVAALALAGKGYDVVGLDLSARAVEQATRTAESAGANVRFGVADLSKSTGYDDYFSTIVDGLVLHSLPESLRDDYLASSARSLKSGGLFAALVFATAAFPPGSDFGPRSFTQQGLTEVVGNHLVVEDVKPARAWINVPATLPAGFEYRDVTIGSDGCAQLPAWLILARKN